MWKRPGTPYKQVLVVTVMVSLQMKLEPHVLLSSRQSTFGRNVLRSMLLFWGIPNAKGNTNSRRGLSY